MEIPDAMVETQQRQTIDEFGQRLQMQGLNLEQYFQFTGLTYEHMMEQVKPQAERRIKSRLVLEAVAAAENIEATEEDFDAEVKRMAEGYKMEADKIKELMGEAGQEADHGRSGCPQGCRFCCKRSSREIISNCERFEHDLKIFLKYQLDLLQKTMPWDKIETDQIRQRGSFLLQ